MPIDRRHTGKITLRSARPEDCRVIARLDSLFFRYAGLTAAQVAYSRRTNPDLVIVARGGAAVVGFLVGSVTRRGEPSLHIVSMGLARAARGRGIGKRLLRLAFRRARAAGATKTRLEVWTRNTRAIRLYESVGFSTVRVRRDYYEPGRDALVMEKRIRP